MANLPNLTLVNILELTNDEENYDVAEDLNTLKLNGAPEDLCGDDLNDIIGKGFTMESFLKILNAPEVNSVETHFKWMLELDGEGMFDRKRIEKLKSRMLSWTQDLDPHLSLCQRVTQYLLLAVYTGLLEGESEEAIKYFSQASEIIQAAKDEPIEHLRVYRYINSTDRLIISRCSELLREPSDNQPCISLSDFFKEIETFVTLSRKVFSLNTSVINAALLAMKGQLANQLSNATASLKLFQEAVDLNPACYDWVHHLYTSLRKKRREIDNYSTPTEAERNACLKAHELRPECWTGLLALANMYQDCNKKFSASNKENERKIIESLEKARKLAPSNVTVCLKLAEGYMQYSSQQNFKAAKKLFEFCKETWPHNSQVYHKFGKYYSVMRDQDNAAACFHKGVEIDPLNFPCLMDYFRLKLPSLTIAEMIKFVDEYISEYKYHLVYSTKLKTLKGFLVWQNNDSTNAIKLWLSVYDISDETDRAAVIRYMRTTMAGRNVIFSNCNYGQTPVYVEVARRRLHSISRQLPDCEAACEMFNEFLSSLEVEQNRSNGNKGFGRDVGSETGAGDQWRKNSDKCSDGRSADRIHDSLKKPPIERILRDPGDPKARESMADSDGDWRRKDSSNFADLPDLRGTIDSLKERNNSQRVLITKTTRIQEDQNGRWAHGDVDEVDCGNRHNRSGTTKNQQHRYYK